MTSATTAHLGVLERIDLGGYLSWVAVLAVALLRDTGDQRSPRRKPLDHRVEAGSPQDGERRGTTLKVLVGSGDRIGLLALPFLTIGLVLNLLWPPLFGVGGPPLVLKVASILVLIPGIAVWIWSVVLILTRVPRHELITDGPYSLVKHPLYTGVALLVAPWIGFLLDTWLGALIGIILYVGSRLFSPEEERAMAETFGPRWDDYCKSVKIPWL